MTVEHVCREYGIPTTQFKSQELNRQRRKIEYKYWVHGINKIIDSFTEGDFDDQFLKFVLSLDFSKLSQDD